SVGPPQARRHPRALVLEADKFRGALDRDAHLLEAIDQEALMLVLRKDERVGEGTDALPHVAEDDATLFLACDPQSGCSHLEPGIDDLARAIDLVVECQDSRTHHHRLRGGARPGPLADPAPPHA